MTLAGKALGIAFPDTVLEDRDTLKEKTVKLGLIARMCAVYGVDQVVVFRDPRGRGESALIRKVMEYLETPQYLRRRLFPLDESLKFAGLLPPLRIPSHKPKVPPEKLKPGEFREGVVLPDGRSVDVGLEQTLALRQAAPPGRRVTVRVSSNRPIEGVLADRLEPKEYWGYSIEVMSLEETLADRRFALKLLTSRKGDDLQQVMPRLQREFGRSDGVMVVFGSPSRGLFEMNRDIRDKAPFVVNLYPEQRAVTVRTEEAMASALYLLEVLTILPNTKV